MRYRTERYVVALTNNEAMHLAWLECVAAGTPPGDGCDVAQLERMGYVMRDTGRAWCLTESGRRWIARLQALRAGRRRNLDTHISSRS